MKIQYLLLISLILGANGQALDKNATERTCSDPVACYNQGIELLIKGNCSEAMEALDNATKLNQSDGNAWVGKAKASSCLGHYEDAIKFCNVALAFDNGSVQAYEVKASAFLSMNKSEEARTVLGEAIRQNVSDSGLWIECGKLYSQMKMWNDAQKCFHRATELNPENAGTWNLEASAFYNLDKYQEALESYNQSVSHNSSNAAAWYERGSLLITLKCYDEALRSFTEAASLKPTDENVQYRKCQLLLLMRKNNEALECYSNLTRQNPNNASFWLGKGYALFKLGRCNESLATYDKAIGLGYDSVSALIGRGDDLLCLGLKNQSLDAYSQALEKDHNFGAALERRANALYLMGKYHEALTFAKKAIKNASYARAWFTYGNALNASHMHEDALEQYQIALKKAKSDSPLDPEIDLRMIVLAIGSTYMHEGDHEHSQDIQLNRSDFQNARDCYENLTEQNKSDEYALLMLGISNYKLWQYNNATECFDRVLDIDPKNPVAAELSGKSIEEKRPHILLNNFTSSGIDIPGLSDLQSGKIITEHCNGTFGNKADADGVVAVSIWTIPNDYVNEVLAASFDVPVSGDSEKKFGKVISIPLNAIRDLPVNPIAWINFLRDLHKIALRCEYTVKNTQ